jgi:predicted metal-dependent hydrolase
VPAEPSLKYLSAYPAGVQAQVRQMLEQGTLGAYLARRYPGRHQVNSDRALYEYVQAIKQERLRSAPPLHKVIFQGRAEVVRNALGLNMRVTRVQGGRLKAKKEIRIASLFKELAPEFLEMIAVHELAHLREFDHSKAFYQLCEHLMPGYAQVEFDLRLHLTARESGHQDEAETPG